MDLDQT